MGQPVSQSYRGQQVSSSSDFVEVLTKRDDVCDKVVDSCQRGQQMKALKDEANALAIRRPLRLAQAAESRPSTSILPLVGMSIPPMRWSRVDFPDPDRPMRARVVPAGTLSVT